MPALDEPVKDRRNFDDHLRLFLQVAVLGLDIHVTYAGFAAIDRKGAVVGDAAVVLQDDVAAAPLEGIEHRTFRHEAEVVRIAAGADKDVFGIARNGPPAA